MCDFCEQQTMKETEIIIAEKLFPNFNNIKYVDWAISLMEKGYENENLYILAGLDNDDTDTREKYFTKAIRELNIEIEQDSSMLIESYAIHIATQVTNKKITVFKGLEIFEKIISITDYDKKYMRFFELDEDLYLLTCKNSDRIKYPMNQVEKESFIYDEFKKFLEENI